MIHESDTRTSDVEEIENETEGDDDDDDDSEVDNNGGDDGNGDY